MVGSAVFLVCYYMNGVKGRERLLGARIRSLHRDSVLQCLPQMIIQSDHRKFQFSVDLGHIFMRTVFTIKSTEDLKSKCKPGSDYYLGKTLSRLETKKRNLHN